MVFCFVYTSIAYYLSAQMMTWTRFLMFLFVCQLMTLISESIGLILGTAMNPVVSLRVCYYSRYTGTKRLRNKYSLPETLFFFLFLRVFFYPFKDFYEKNNGTINTKIILANFMYCTYSISYIAQVPIAISRFQQSGNFSNN